MLVLLQPDLGTAIIMVIVLLVMLAVAGLPIRILVMLLVATALVALVAIEGGFLHHYQIARLTTFLNPSSHSNNPYVQSTIYNTQQAKIAIGSGGLLGSGIGHGAQTNLGYVPEQQTDFIFTAVAEQLGFIGSVGLLSLLGMIAWRVLHAAVVSRDTFGRLICAGLFAFIAFSVFQNAGMTMGIMPITGIPLPFVSYGGTAVLVFFSAVGLALERGRSPEIQVTDVEPQLEADADSGWRDGPDAGGRVPDPDPVRHLPGHGRRGRVARPALAVPRRHARGVGAPDAHAGLPGRPPRGDGDRPGPPPDGGPPADDPRAVRAGAPAGPHRRDRFAAGGPRGGERSWPSSTS